MRTHHVLVYALRTLAGVLLVSVSGAGNLPTPSSIPDLIMSGDCPDAGPAGAVAREAASSAYIPLVVGLTLSYAWKRNAEDYEHECLTQVDEIDARSVGVTGSCPDGPKREMYFFTRKLCWKDLADSYLYLPGWRPKDPEVFAGALMFGLSRASLTALKSTGKVRHRYVHIERGADKSLEVVRDIDGILHSDGPGTFSVVVNGKTIEAPAIWASYINQPKGQLIRVKVLDDIRFPLMFDYYFPVDRYFITYTNISYPAVDDVDKQLSTDKRADVYGIYFDFASDTMRRESEPVLREIAAVMKAHPDWHVTINGHTDNVGDAAQNLDLSRRRAASVRNVLVQRFQIDVGRFSTGGFGASQPKESNNTDRGRARNRRVELTRQ